MLPSVQPLESVHSASSAATRVCVSGGTAQLTFQGAKTRFSTLAPALALGLLSTLLFGGCQRSRSAERNSAGAASAERRDEELQKLTATYRSRGLAERMKAAADGCYVGGSCQSIHHQALLAGADDESEREALRATARPVFARQYHDELRRRRHQAEQVRAVGSSRRTLRVKGPLCSRFFLANFAGRPEARVARTLGFTRVECESQAVRAGLDLGSAE